MGPKGLNKLIQQEIDDGLVEQFPGDETDAKRAWPDGVAKGKLGVARADGRDVRLVLDTTISGVNPQAMIPEKASVPNPYDVRHHIQDSPDVPRLAMVLDVSKAHKRIRLGKRDQGLMFFEHEGKLYLYKVCHFGSSFSDWWWKRVAALPTDITHGVLWVSHAGHVYVDDWLWILLQSFGMLQASLILLNFVSQGVPLI